ncbi:MAG: hypothetical protein RLZZ28_1854, partial [Bacteroidota bacterium]
DEKLMMDSLPIERYNRMSEILEAKHKELIMQHATLAKSKNEFHEYITYACSFLFDISGYYSKASFFSKQKLIGSIFPKNLTFDGKSYRTERINEVFALLFNVDRAYKQKQPNKNVELSSWAPPSGLEPETL